MIPISLGLDIELKSGIKYVISRNYAKMKIDSDEGVPTEETLTLHNVAMLINSAFNEHQNHCYYTATLTELSLW